MTTERPCVYIPVDEYRDLVKAKRDADCLKAIIKAKKRDGWHDELSSDEVKMLCAMFIDCEAPAQEDESW